MVLFVAQDFIKNDLFLWHSSIIGSIEVFFPQASSPLQNTNPHEKVQRQSKNYNFLLSEESFSQKIFPLVSHWPKLPASHIPPKTITSEEIGDFSITWFLWTTYIYLYQTHMLKH